MKIKFPKNIKSLKLPKEESRSKIIKRLDKVFGDFIKKRDKYTCVRCGRKYEKGAKNLSCSHFWVRENMGTRYNEDNCATLCKYPCHFQKWEKQKNGEYQDYMLRKLGRKKFDMLEIKAKGACKLSRQDLLLLIKIYEDKTAS